MDYIPEEVAREYIVPYLSLDDLYNLGEEQWFRDRMLELIKHDDIVMDIYDLMLETDDPEIAKILVDEYHKYHPDRPNILQWLYDISTEIPTHGTIKWLIDRSMPNEALKAIPFKIFVQNPDVFYLALEHAIPNKDLWQTFVNVFVPEARVKTKCKIGQYEHTTYTEQYSQNPEDYKFPLIELLKLFARSGQLTLPRLKHIGFFEWEKNAIRETDDLEGSILLKYS